MQGAKDVSSMYDEITHCITSDSDGCGKYVHGEEGRADSLDDAQFGLEN